MSKSSQSRFRSILSRRAALLAAAAVAAGGAPAVLAAGPAEAAVAGATTVANFCSFSGALGTVHTGQTAGHDYAAWEEGTSYFDYYAFDLDGDTHVDAVVYAPIVAGRYDLRDIGVCTGPYQGRWYNVSATDRSASVAATTGGSTYSSSSGSSSGTLSPELAAMEMKWTDQQASETDSWLEPPCDSSYNGCA